MVQEERSETTKLYGIRWWVLCLIGVFSMLVRIFRSSFGVVNDVYVSYFNVSYETVDWFSLIQFPGVTISSVILAMILFNKLLSSKILAVVMSGCLAFTSITLIIAYLHTYLYYVIFVGQFVLGISLVIVDPISASYATSWFPEHQIGIALNTKEIDAGMGCLLGYIIPSNLLLVPRKSNYSSNSTLPMSSSQSIFEPIQEWFAKDRFRLIVFSSVSLVEQ